MIKKYNRLFYTNKDISYEVKNTAGLILRYFCVWWANRDSNPGPTGYEPVALTN